MRSKNELAAVQCQGRGSAVRQGPMGRADAMMLRCPIITAYMLISIGRNRPAPRTKYETLRPAFQVPRAEYKVLKSEGQN
jgi:hypothetical protein